MGLIKNLFSLLTIMWIWKDTLRLIFTIVSVGIILGGTLFLSIHYHITILWILILASYYLNMGSSIFPNVEIITDIVKGDKSGELNCNESMAILALAVIVNYCNIHKVPDKIQTFTSSLSNTILSDWILIAFYVISIFVCIFSVAHY